MITRSDDGSETDPDDPLALILRPTSDSLGPPPRRYEAIRRSAARRRLLRAAAGVGLSCAAAALVAVPFRLATTSDGPAAPTVPLAPPPASTSSTSPTPPQLPGPATPSTSPSERDGPRDPATKTGRDIAPTPDRGVTTSEPSQNSDVPSGARSGTGPGDVRPSRTGEPSERAPERVPRQ